MIFKVDFAKAYDSIRWDFLEDVLTSFGFGPQWCSWIRGSLKSGKSSILVNGSPTTEFHLFRGLKQGDPIAPFLFLLIMEAFHLSFNRAVEAGTFKGYKFDSSLTLSHLFYADDAVFIGEWSQDNLKGIMHILRCFSILSGMTINFQKSQLLGVGICDNHVYLVFSLSTGLLSSNGFGVFFLMTRQLFMARVIARRYHGSSSHPISAAYNSPWGTIIKEVKALNDKGINLVSHCKIRVGNGLRTSFWNDLWIGDNQLKLSFPRLFALEVNKDCSVADKLNAPFTASFRRQTRGGPEAQQLEQLTNLLDSVSLSNMEDRCFGI
ncbi:RNA-directed DNA polymerase, eukaryota [Tanacetum coccineum]